MLIILTITCMLLIIYHHVGYPLLLKKLTEHSSVQSALPTKKRHACALTPVSITLVIPAYNEQQYIAEKIRNVAILDYPPELIKVIIP